MATYTVATWNVQAIGGASDVKLGRVAEALATCRPDVVALQEVSSGGKTFEMLAPLLHDVDLRYTHFSGEQASAPAPPARAKRYGNVIASRWPIAPVGWPVATTWPQLIASADVTLPEGRVRVVSVHIPNGSGNGWQKVYALEALREGLLAAADPCIVMGDFNEPRTFTPALLSFRARPNGSVDGDWSDQFGDTHPRARWQRAVVALLGPDEERGSGDWPGQLATRQCATEPEATHLVQAREPRYFDHILTTAPITVTGVAYDHSVRLGSDPISDHSMERATLALPDVQSMQTDTVGAVDTPYGRIAWHDGPLTDATRIFLETAPDGETAAHELLLGSLIAHTNGDVLRYLPKPGRPTDRPAD